LGPLRKSHTRIRQGNTEGVREFQPRVELWQPWEPRCQTDLMGNTEGVREFQPTVELWQPWG